MPIIIKKGAAKGEPRPAPVLAEAPKAQAKAKPGVGDKLREALFSDPRYIASKELPVGSRAKVCEFCGAVYIVPCDNEEKQFCPNLLFKQGVIKNIDEWSPYAQKGNELRLKRHEERMSKAGE